MNNKALITKAYSDAGVVDIISNIVSCQHATMITNDVSFTTVHCRALGRSENPQEGGGYSNLVTGWHNLPTD